MKAVIVTYTVEASFAETNAANIASVMAELCELGDDGIRYQAFRQQDGVTFVHFGMYRDEAAQNRATELESFKAFQQQLRESKPVSRPNATWLDASARATRCSSRARRACCCGRRAEQRGATCVRLRRLHRSCASNPWALPASIEP